LNSELVLRENELDTKLTEVEKHSDELSEKEKKLNTLEKKLEEKEIKVNTLQDKLMKDEVKLQHEQEALEEKAKEHQKNIELDTERIVKQEEMLKAKFDVMNKNFEEESMAENNRLKEIEKRLADEQEKLDAIDACTIFLQPSYFESFSMALTEAWSLRCAALVQGRCEVLSGHADRSGGAVKYDGFAEFEAAVDLLLENQEIIEELGINGRSYVEENYQWSRIISRYEKLLEEVVVAFNQRRPQN